IGSGEDPPTVLHLGPKTCLPTCSTVARSEWDICPPRTPQDWLPRTTKVNNVGEQICRTESNVLIYSFLNRIILEKEGVRSLFRGLGPNLIGVAPSRAIYFAAYSGTKERLNTVLMPESKKVHMISAACAGITSATLTNPIWLVKTRMQLERRGRNERCTSALQCAMRVYYREGLRGFYRGVTASYAGVTETVIHFVLYEALKQRLREHQLLLTPSVVLSPSGQDFCGLMAAAAVSKACASCIAYPHEVVRTRLREEGCRYRSFVQTLQLVAREEGPLALYRGLSAHLLRQIPNAAIVMVTYELIIHLATKM
uniref:Solute carrier family 25 member 33 n=1 Tax=Naja naja TaxID=35670 RepID=A0A8C6XXS6_NAJNA